MPNLVGERNEDAWNLWVTAGFNGANYAPQVTNPNKNRTVTTQSLDSGDVRARDGGDGGDAVIAWRLARHEPTRGQSLVEFALILPIFLVVLPASSTAGAWYLPTTPSTMPHASRTR